MKKTKEEERRKKIILSKIFPSGNYPIFHEKHKTLTLSFVAFVK